MSQFQDIRWELRQRIAHIDAQCFERISLDVFQFQARFNPLYRQYLQLLGIQPTAIEHSENIPYLPIGLFKNHAIRTGSWRAGARFTSSGTTATSTSTHLVSDMDWYLHNTRRGFEHQYGDLSKFSVLALLPSYLERTGSSLVAMAEYFIQLNNTTKKPTQNGFYLQNHSVLLTQLAYNQQHQIQTLLLGVSFALLDLAQAQDLSTYLFAPEFITIMETGGMKGRRAEITRAELHAELKQAFGVAHIHSEYGMTELFSQAYAPQDGIFWPAPTLRASTTELQDPFCRTAPQKVGILNFIDLANLDTCSFIATEDLGRIYRDGSFEVIGRADIAEVRGCNLMVE